MDRNQLRLSRTISHALRHEPWLYELELDSEGWVKLDTLLWALRGQRREWGQLTELDVVNLMEAAEERRFEVRSGRIRALYGHSTQHRLQNEPVDPPKLLYHGTSPEALERIIVEGLRPMNRQYVHLSVDHKTAMKVGQRKSGKPVVLQVEAEKAHDAGVAFYKGNNHVWLADTVPPEYFCVIAAVFPKRVPPFSGGSSQPWG